MSVFRPEIETLPAYHLTVQPCRIKLNQNENPFELPDGIKREILDRLASLPWSRYPPFVPSTQIEKVAAFANWRSDGILLGNGSNDLLQLLFTCLLERGKAVVLSQPTFTLYKLLGRGLAANVVEVPMLKAFAFDVEGIVHEANRTAASLIVVCSPNNPTGTGLKEGDLRKILESTSSIVVLDEAYAQFAHKSQVELLREYDRLVILQTFSKAMAAAGLRFGFVLAQPSVVRQLAKVKLPYSVNIFTLIAAEVCIENWATLRHGVEEIRRERDMLFLALTAMKSLRVSASEANFLLFETLEKTPSEIFNGLLDRGILIRDVSSYPLLERGLRVSVGRPEENREFIDALKEVLCIAQQ